MHTHKHPKACIRAGIHTHANIWLTTADFPFRQTYTHFWHAVVHSVKRTKSVPGWYSSPSTWHTTSESLIDIALFSVCVCVCVCVCVWVCPSAHTKALVNRIKVSVHNTTLPTHTPACLWLCWRDDRQSCMFLLCVSVYDDVAWNENRERHTVYCQTLSPIKVDYIFYSCGIQVLPSCCHTGDLQVMRTACLNSGNGCLNSQFLNLDSHWWDWTGAEKFFTDLTVHSISFSDNDSLLAI